MAGANESVDRIGFQLNRYRGELGTQMKIPSEIQPSLQKLSAQSGL